MGFLVKGIKSVVKAVGKVVGSVVKVVGGIFGFAIGGGSKGKSKKGADNLNKSLDPEAFRKIILGKTASPLDVRYWEVYGTNGQYFDEIIALASHKINSIKELYLEEKLAIDASGVVQSPYFGVLARDTRLGAVGQTGIGVGALTQYTSAGATFDGVAHIKLVWVPDEKKLPNGIPSRYTQICEGALVYDPRRDSTRGGSGLHRANDRTTWEYAPTDANGVPIGRNNALQTLWYLLGWTIPMSGGGEMLVCGRGIDPDDINMATFIAGANACETAAYYTDLVLSTEDSHTDNEDKITCSGLIGRLIDPGGLWSYYANVNDTASVAVYLTDADVLEGSQVRWEEYQGMSEQYNQVRGKFVYPATPVLFQPFPYPMVRDATYEANLGVKRAKTLDFEQVLDSTLAQRLARLFLNEGQYQGEYTANFGYRAINAQAWSVVSYTSERFGFTKLFRVWRQGISTDSGVQMLLKEIHSSIWGAGSVTAPLAPGLGLTYQANQEIAVAGAAIFAHTFIAPDGTKGDGFRLSWTQPSLAVRRTEVRYKLTGTTYWSTLAPIERDVTAAIVGPLLSGAYYDVALRHVSVNEVPGPWTSFNNTANGSEGNVNYAAIIAAGGTATRNLPGQKLQDANFLETYWTLNGSITFAFADALSGVALSIPYSDNGLARYATYGGSGGYYLSVEPGRKLFVRFVCDPEAMSGVNSFIMDGADYLYDGVDRLLDIASSIKATWNLVAVMNFYTANGTLISQPVIATVLPSLNRQVISAKVSVPSTAFRARLLIGYPVQAGKTGSWAFWEPWINEHEPAADITVENTPDLIMPENQTIACFANGVPKAGQLPRTVFPVRKRGQLNITQLSTWTANSVGCGGTINNNPASPTRGALTISSMATENAYAIIYSSLDGVEMSGRINFTKKLDLPETPVAIVGISTTPTLVNRSVSEEVNSNSYSIVYVSVIVAVPASGIIDAVAPLEYTAYYSTAGVKVAGKWRYRVVGGGAWTDMAAEIEGTSAIYRTSNNVYEPDNYEEPGGISVNQIVSGLASGNYEVELILRRSFGSVAVPIVGSATIQTRV